MKYILDTDTLIYFLKGNAHIVEKVASISAEKITTTIVNHTELLYGAYNSQKKKHKLSFKKALPSLLQKYLHWNKLPARHLTLRVCH